MKDQYVLTWAGHQSPKNARMACVGGQEGRERETDGKNQKETDSL